MDFFFFLCRFRTIIITGRSSRDALGYGTHKKCGQGAALSRKPFQVQSFNNVFKKYKKEEEGWVTISVWHRILPFIFVQTAHYAWVSVARPSKLPEPLKTDSISNVSRSVQKVLKYCSESAKRKSALVNAKFHQSHNLLPRLGFEGSTAVKWWIYLIYMRVIHKIIWTDRLTPTSLAVRRKRCTSVSFLNSANICEARFCTNMTWHIFFHFQTFAVRCKSHPLTHSNALERFPSFSHLSLAFLIAETNLSALAPPFILKCLPDLQCNTFSYFWSHPLFSVRPALYVAPGEASWMESSGHQRWI